MIECFQLLTWLCFLTQEREEGEEGEEGEGEGEEEMLVTEVVVRKGWKGAAVKGMWTWEIEVRRSAVVFFCWLNCFFCILPCAHQLALCQHLAIKCEKIMIKGTM